MSEHEIRAAIVGAGAIAMAHARAYADTVNTGLVGVCDVDAGRAGALAEHFRDVRVYSRLQTMLEGADPDVISICTPGDTHADIAVQALEAGVHVLCEKPMAQTLRACDRMIAASRSSKRVLAVVLQNRLNIHMARLKWLLDAACFGDNVIVGGYGWTVHLWDLIGWLLGDPVRIFAQWMGRQRVGADPMLVDIFRDHGRHGHIRAAHARYCRMTDTAAWSSWVHVSGSRLDVLVPLFLDTMNINGGDAAYVQRIGGRMSEAVPCEGYGRGMPPSEHPDVVQGIVAHYRQCHGPVIRDFVHAVRHGGRVAVDGLEGRRSVELVTAAYQSALCGKIIPLPVSKTSSFYASMGREVSD